MSENTAILGNDASLYISTEDIAASPPVYKEIQQVTGTLTFDDGTSAKVDVTHLKSEVKEFRAGKPDTGSLRFEMLTDFAADGSPDMSGQNELRLARADGKKRLFKIVWNDGSISRATVTVAKADTGSGLDAPRKSSVECYAVSKWVNE